jgi:hypothetical protein
MPSSHQRFCGNLTLGGQGNTPAITIHQCDDDGVVQKGENKRILCQFDAVLNQLVMGFSRAPSNSSQTHAIFVVFFCKLTV